MGSRPLHLAVVPQPKSYFDSGGMEAFDRLVADDAQRFCWCNSGKRVEKVPIACRPIKWMCPYRYRRGGLDTRSIVFRHCIAKIPCWANGGKLYRKDSYNGQHVRGLDKRGFRQLAFK